MGSNGDGRLGAGSGAPSQSATPIKVVLPAGVTAKKIAAAGSSSYLLGSDGKIYAWGANGKGQLASGDSAPLAVPTPIQLGAIPSTAKIDKIVASVFNGYAVDTTGKIYAWGDNSYGQLGLGSSDPTPRRLPFAVTLPGGVTANDLAAPTNAYFALVIGSDGALYAWGWNAFGQLGDGSTTNRSAPVAVQTPAGVRFSLVGTTSGSSFAVSTSGTTYAWGSNLHGQLADGSKTDRSLPRAMDAGAMSAAVAPTALVAGDATIVALGSDGYLYEAGWGAYGQLGNANTSDATSWVAPSRVPASLTPPSAAITVATGAQLVTPTLRAVGVYGTISFTSQTSLPSGLALDAKTGAVSGVSSVRVPSTNVTIAATGTRASDGVSPKAQLTIEVSDPYFTDVASGWDHVLAVDVNGDVFSWGKNTSGVLGDGTETDRSAPVWVPLPTGVKIASVATGLTHSLAMSDSGDVYAWGSNALGQLGIDGMPDSGTHTPVPVTLPGGARAKQIATGGWTSYVLTSDGVVYAWGRDGNGELGDGSNQNRTTPVAMKRGDIPDGVAISRIFGTATAASPSTRRGSSMRGAATTSPRSDWVRA